MTKRAWIGALGLACALVAPVVHLVACYTSADYPAPTCADDGGDCEAGPPAQCSSDGECGGPAQCASYACVDGTCKPQYFVAGTALPDTVKGDCERPACDGDGGVEHVPDPSDVPDASDQCHEGACSGDGGIAQADMPPGTPCDAGGVGIVCDGVGSCVSCLDAGDCTGSVCYKCNGVSCGDSPECKSNNCGCGSSEPCSLACQP
jgi:hypothetical protein